MDAIDIQVMIINISVILSRLKLMKLDGHMSNYWPNIYLHLMHHNYDRVKLHNVTIYMYQAYLQSPLHFISCNL